MDDQIQQPQPTFTQSPIYQEAPEGKNAKWLWILIVLIVVGALAFAFLRGIGPFANLKSSSPEASPTPESEVTVASPSPEASPGANIDKASAKVRVLNGSGRAGVASSAKDFIESKGYKVTVVGNAANFDFETTVIRLKGAFASFADALVADLSDKYSVSISDDELDATNSADIEIIVGSK